MLDSLLAANPDDFRIHLSRGYAFAGLGRTSEAVESARRYVETAVGSAPGEVYFTRGYEFRAAQVLGQAGLVDEAVAALDRLLSVPSFVTVARLRLQHYWDPVRDHPRFQALLEKYGSEN
jgi:hypothetical protein